MVAEGLWVSDLESLPLSGGVGVGGMEAVADCVALILTEFVFDRRMVAVLACDMVMLCDAVGDAGCEMLPECVRWVNDCDIVPLVDEDTVFDEECVMDGDCDKLCVSDNVTFNDAEGERLMEWVSDADFGALRVMEEVGDSVAVYNVARTNSFGVAGTNHRLPSPSETMPMNLPVVAAGSSTGQFVCD